MQRRNRSQLFNKSSRCNAQIQSQTKMINRTMDCTWYPTSRTPPPPIQPLAHIPVFLLYTKMKHNLLMPFLWIELPDPPWGQPSIFIFHAPTSIGGDTIADCVAARGFCRYACWCCRTRSARAILYDFLITRWRGQRIWMGGRRHRELWRCGVSRGGLEL